MTRSATPAAMIVESDCALVVARGRRIVVLTERPACSGLLDRVAPTLRALGSGPAAGAVILLGPGSLACDLSFSPGHGGAAVRDEGELYDFAVAAALTARLVGRVLAEPTVIVAARESSLLHLVPPPRWWRGTWLARRRNTTVRVAARLLLHGGLVLG